MLLSSKERRISTMGGFEEITLLNIRSADYYHSSKDVQGTRSDGRLKSPTHF